jgi:hypothetical protein
LFDIKRFIDKFRELIPTEDVVSILEKLPDDPTLNQISENAGTVGAVIKIALHITEKVYEAKVPVEKRLSLTLMRIMLESAKDSFPYSVSNVKIEDIFDKGSSQEFENIVLELFEKHSNKSVSKKPIISYLPDHPAFIKFKDLLSNGIKEFNRKNKSNIDVSLFTTEFNSNLLIKLEDEKADNQELRTLLHKWKVNSDFQNIREYLKNAKDLFFEPNKIDGKSLLNIM